MYRHTFIAWFCLCVPLICLIAYLIALPYIGAEWARSGFGVLGLGLLGLLMILQFVLFRKEANDERDKSFRQRSLYFGYTCGFWVIVFLNFGLTLVYSVLHGVDFVSLSVFWLPAICGFWIGLLAFSVLLLILCYKGERADPWGLTKE
jgi:Na+/proline symporter